MILKRSRYRFELFVIFSITVACYHTSLHASDEVEKAGDVLQYLIPAAAYGATFYFEDPDGRVQFYKSFVANLSITYGLKEIINKNRPNGSGSEKSFPSAHTSGAFQGATYIHRRYGFKYAIPAYLASTLVGYSRVQSDEHYTSDVIAGAVIGIASSFYFTKKYKQFEIEPSVENGSYGLLISRKW